MTENTLTLTPDLTKMNVKNERERLRKFSEKNSNITSENGVSVRGYRRGELFFSAKKNSPSF